MKPIRNILFIMCDQLRADYLGCNGHPTLKTRNIDWLAAQGVTFQRAYVQAPVCGPSRMSFYTGRYVSSHGATWNRSPLRIDETTMAHALSDHGLHAALIGKSHIVIDPKARRRFGLEGRHVAEGGFDPVERDDGVHRSANVKPDLAYNAFLRAKGYESANPWHDFANSAAGSDGEVLSGWRFRNADKPASVAEPHSETAYMTDRALEFIETKGDAPWFLHLSYIKPHWPYMAPAPYHAIYGPEQIKPAIKGGREKSEPHPIARVLMSISDGVAFQDEQTRRTVIPTYMGLVHQIDDHLGRVFALLRRLGRMQDTLIVFTSDHGDHLGDHWLADKGLFYEQAVRVPLILYDPREAANPTRGVASDTLVESIDLFPTFLDAVGAEDLSHRLEGESLTPILHGQAATTRRNAVFSEMDYAFIETRDALGLDPHQAMGRMARTARWKYVRFDGLPPQLFDLAADPQELNDLGADPNHGDIRQTMETRLLEWSLARKTRVTMSQDKVTSWLEAGRKRGIAKAAW